MDAFEKFLKFKGVLTGVDIGYDTIKLVTLRKDGLQNFFESTSIVNIPPKVLEEKDAAKEVVAKALLEAFKNAKPKKIYSKFCVTGLPESKVFTKIIQMPQMTDDELKTAVPNEAARHVPIPPQEIYLDWQNLGVSGKKFYDILIIAAPRYLVENYLAVFELAKLELIAIETKPIAASRALIKKAEKEAILILDVGAEATGITIYDSGVIKFTSTIPHGGNTFTKNIANALNVDTKTAEKLKREQGFKTDNDTEATKGLEPVMNDILEEVNNAIKFFESRAEPQKEISLIRICGGGALTPEIAPFVEDTISRKTTIANPFINVNPKSWRKLTAEQILRLTTAVGLALRERY